MSTDPSLLRRLRGLPPVVLILGALGGLVVAVTAAQIAIGLHSRTTLASLVRRFVEGRQEADSWRIMGLAIEHLRSGSGTNVYDALFFEQQVKFQYPLSSLLFVWDLSASTLVLLSQLAVLLTGWATWIVLRRSLAASGYEPPRGWIGPAAVIGLTVLFFPVIKAFALGQVQTWINALFAWMLAAWLLGRWRTSGVLLGLVLLIKPTFAPLLLWGAFRRRWAFVTAAAAVALAGTLATVALFGVDQTFAYVDVVRHLGMHGEAFYPNQSWNGLLHRLFENGDALQFDRHGFPPFHAGVYAGTVTAMLAMTVFALWWPTRTPGAGGAVDLAIMALTATMTSPVAWDHHYGVLLPIVALVVPPVVAARPFGRATWPIVIVAYVASAQTFFNMVTRVERSPWNLVQSYQFLAAGVVLVLAYRALRVDRVMARLECQAR